MKLTALFPRSLGRPALLALLALLPALHSAAQTPTVAPRLPMPIPMPVRPSPSDLQPATVESVTVQARVVGRTATTRVDIVLRNPNHTVIESALQFPLREGQTVTGFALESLDRSRYLSAAPVEKAKGQAVFEQIVREGVDPALLEKTAGNNFKLRVYPITPQQTRAVRLEISEFLLPGEDGRLRYPMPQMLKDAQPAQFTFKLELPGVAQSAVSLSDGLKTALQGSTETATRISFSPENKLGHADYAVSWAPQDRVFTDYGSLDGERYFHAQVPLSLERGTRKPVNPLTLVWDASGSGAKRDHAREFALLDAVFKSVGNVTVHLIETHVVAEPARSFEVRQGNWRALRDALEAVRYDGASNPAAWAAQIPVKHGFPKEFLAGFRPLTLVFTDGLGNWGAPPPVAPNHTLYAIGAAPTTHSAAMRALAEPTGGQYIDLLQTPVAQAVAELTTLRARLVRISGDGADRLVRVSPYAEGGVVQIAGRMTRDSASVTLEFAMPDGSTQQRSVALQHKGDAAQDASPLAAQRWAAMRIAELEANARLHQAEILRLGSEFGVVSSRTSLIILERLEDYLRFDVMPSDPDWRAQYKKRATSKAAREAAEQANHLAMLLRKFEARIQWWNTDYPKDSRAEPVKKEAARSAGMAMEMAAAPPPMMAPPPPPPPAPAAVRAASPMADAAAQNAKATEKRRDRDVAPTMWAADTREMAISVQKQQLDSAYARRLGEASAADRYAIYLDEKTANASNAAFYLDASDIFFDKGQPAQALRILSNLAEMDLEDRALLRILAYRLQQARQFDQAILLFKQVLVLAPNEPQSWRDLGLAYAANGMPQQAVDALWTTAYRKWDPRFADIGLIALGELNAIAATNPGLDLSRVDPRLVRNLPVDLRVVLGWDADNTDIDLWVKDPNGDDAYYGRQLTYQGGRMSSDFTGGYGPEEFILKVAKPGRYEVRAKFFGSRQQKFSPHTTVMLRFITGFGTKKQKEQSVILRLPQRGSEVLVGSFEVKP